MKTIWNVVSFLAVVHLLTLAMFIGWLWASQRLDGPRVQAVRAMFSMTIEESEAATADAAEAAQREREQVEMDERRRRPPLPSKVRTEISKLVNRQTDQSVRRLDDLKQQMLQQLAQATAQLEQDRAALEAEQARWRESVAAAQQQKSDEQFRKTVKLIESLPAKQAKERIVDLVNKGKTDQAVAYLNAMNQRAAGKLLAEFKTDQESQMATELLERLRTFGTGAADAGAGSESSDADSVANAQ